MKVNTSRLPWAVGLTLLMIVYYAWMIPAWIHLDDSSAFHSEKRLEDMNDEELDAEFERLSSKEGASDGSQEEVDRGEPPPDLSYFIIAPRYSCNSVLKINTSGDASYVIKVVDPMDGELMLLYYLPAGASREIDIPSGTFEIRYTSGTRWYGEDEMFGPTGSYAKADGTFTFTDRAGYELTLYRVPHGNLHTSTLRKEDF